MYALCRIIGLKIGLSFEKSMPVLTRANITEINIKPVLRTFLSSSYVSKSDAEALVNPLQEHGEMAMQTLALDRCYEREMPVSSLMVDRMMRSIKNKEHLKGVLYYLYKFRHSQNGYYLQPWTIFTFVSKCIKMDANVLLDALRDKMQYGIFPNHFMMNLLVDHFLQTNNLEGAVKGVSEMFLLEKLDNKIAQALALRTISEFWKQNCENDQLMPDFKDTETKRNLSAALLITGLYMSQPSLIISGNSLLGSIESEHGIRTIYQDPWGPLSTEPGYLLKALDCLSASTTSISQQCVDIFLQCVSVDENLLLKARIGVENLKNKQLISDNEELNLEGLANAAMRNLSQYEEEEREKIAKELKTWRSDCDLLCEIEREIAAEFEESRKDHFREIEIETKAHRMAVETLGYWDFDKDRLEEDTQTEEKPVYYLRKDYVEGAMEDLDLAERFREKRAIVRDPVVLIS